MVRLRNEIDDLDERFWTWRALQAPRSRDDLPRLDRPRNWRPGWSASDVADHQSRLDDFADEHRALLGAASTRATSIGVASISAASIGAGDRADEVDLRLLGSAIARARYEIDGVASWRRDPWFYLDQTIGTIYDLLLPPPPIDERRCHELVVRLESFGASLTSGRENCSGQLGLELGKAANGVAPRAGRDLRDCLAELAPLVGPIWADKIERAGSVAARELDGFAEWLAQALGKAVPIEALGESVFARYLYEVALLPFTPRELLAVGRQEWDRAVAFELFEQHRMPDVSWPELPASAAAQVRAEALAEKEVREFYEDHDLLSQPTSLRHYLNHPRPSYLEPISWLGVSDDLTGPARLEQDGISYVPEPSADLAYFYRANAADPRAGIIHEGAHYQQLVLAWGHDRPARRHFYDSCPNEGIAFYNEEMLTQAGLFDDAPLTRRIVYNFMRLRALRVEVDVNMALGELSIEDGGELLADRVPMDRKSAREEAAFFAATPAQGLSYTVGKAQVMRLLADVRSNEGPSFVLREFHDWLWRNGNVPLALLRYERLGDRADLDRVDALRSSPLAPAQAKKETGEIGHGEPGQASWP